MHIGVAPELNPAAGGAHQYALTVLEALASPGVVGASQCDLLLGDCHPDPLLAARLADWPRHSLYPPLPFHKRLAHQLLGAQGRAWLRRLRGGVSARSALQEPTTPIDVDRPPFDRPALRAYLQGLGFDWLFFLMPHPLTVEIGMPFVMPIHDLQHRLQPEFPETSADGQWEEREHFYRHVARRALLVLADSETGKEDVLNCYSAYGITPERVHVVPFLPAAYARQRPDEETCARLLADLHLPERYFFYPAQFWPHKNHERIAEAVALLRDRAQARVHVVFCGSHSNPTREATHAALRRRIDALGVGDQLHFLSYVPNETLTALYCRARALLMPTFFGPTNIPPLEAWSLNCPVITSDIRGIREQMGDAAELVDPRSVESMAEGMRRIWDDDARAAHLIERGRARLEAYPPSEFNARIAGAVMAANAACS